MTDSIVPVKRCRKCGKEKHATPEYFNRTKNNQDGLISYCKQCASEYNRHRYQQPGMAEEVRARAKAYRQTPDGKKRRRELNKERRKRAEVRKQESDYHRRRNQIPEIKQRREKYREQWLQRPGNKELQRTLTRAWGENNPDKKRNQWIRYRARKRGLPDTFTTQDWQRALEYFNGCCAVCGRQHGLWLVIAADHWIPLNNKGCPGTVPGNIVPLCHGIDGCNNSKQDSSAEDWLTNRYGEKKAIEILKRITAYFEWIRGF